MHLHKKVLMVAITLVFVASIAAASVSAQTSGSVVTRIIDNAGSSALTTAGSSVTAPEDNSVATSAPIVSATYKTPTTLVVWAEKQSVQKSHYSYPPPAGSWFYHSSYRLTLRTGGTYLAGQKIYVYYKLGTDEWRMKTVTTVPPGTIQSFGFMTSKPHTQQVYLVFPGTSTYAAAKSNVITVKCEKTKTTPYLTTLYAYAPKQVVAHGTTNTMYAKLQSGATPLTGKSIYIWKWAGGHWTAVNKIITLTGTQAGFALASYRSNSAGTGLYKFTFGGASPYGPSASNTVQLIWT